MKLFAALMTLALPATAVAHTTGAPHLHSEHGASWVLGVALITLAAGTALRRAHAGRRK